VIAAGSDILEAARAVVRRRFGHLPTYILMPA
jgi:hypothetical protein